MRETLIYGLESGESRPYMETLLASGVNLNVSKIFDLASLNGFHSFRVAYFNGEKPNFEKALAI